ncbi:MAG TPA: chemotaxis-specific protein-glutamate methyltransferase CheB [Polyangiaceae bacterium]|nr:chemotaxis-specific protein-glutamate methyltransferase CheB [Polyangiaceae bacterium]
MESVPLRVLVVDDSAYNRRNIGDILASAPDIELIGKAGDGEEALRLATTLRPDVITLDLEMPKMDGFTFLRILMSRQPTPVIVVSSYSQKENVFKALELGAVDFVAKPDRQVSPDAHELKEQILSKMQMIRNLRAPAQRTARREGVQRASLTNEAPAPPPPQAAGVTPRNIVVIGSSTGGPTALLEVFAKMPARSSVALLVAQHMPDKFTRTFAERLDRKGAMRVTEGQDMEVISAGTGAICPGRQCMEIESIPGTQEHRIRIAPAASTDRYVPSANRLFKSAARALGRRAIAVILTGMGDDGVEGAKEIRNAGGIVIAESQETAVVYGMPGAAVRAGVTSDSLALPLIADYLANLR